MTDIQYRLFAIDKTPYCVWDWDITEHDLRFLESLDPGYFEHLATTHGAMLQEAEQQYAAITLRVAYSHALETLFALLGATVQAPDCVVGWLTKYQNNELNEVVRKIHHQEPLLSKLPLKPVTWNSIADTVLAFQTGSDEQDNQIRAAFAQCWHKLAKEFLEDTTSYEYNSIKHGLRVHMGGSWLAMGLESEPGVPAPPEAMHLLGHSTYGTSFYLPEQLGDKRNLRLKRHFVNWEPTKFVYSLHLISMSITNITSYLKCVNGVEATEVQCVWPSDMALFDAPWNERPRGMNISSMNSILDPSWIRPLSKEDILSVYDEDAST